jgi:hypothetical protein
VSSISRRERMFKVFIKDSKRRLYWFYALLKLVMVP